MTKGPAYHQVGVNLTVFFSSLLLFHHSILPVRGMKNYSVYSYIFWFRFGVFIWGRHLDRNSPSPPHHPKYVYIFKLFFPGLYVSPSSEALQSVHICI